MAMVINPTIPAFKRVKNLGWLLKHTSQVQKVYVDSMERSNAFDCRMVVHLDNDKVFTCAWASRTVLMQWLLHRRGLRETLTSQGQGIVWFGQTIYPWAN